MGFALEGVMSDRERSVRGFSLVEMLAVVAIIAIMSAIAIPAVGRYIHNYQIRTGTSAVATEMNSARLKAISKNVQIGVVFAVTGLNTFQYVIEDDTAAPATWWSPTTENFANLVGTVGFQAGQAGVPQTLPAQVQFASPALCGAAGPNAWGVRFTKLGAACQFGAAGCGAAPNGAAAYTNYIYFNNGTATVCLQDPPTNLVRSVAVSSGGRILVQQ